MKKVLYLMPAVIICILYLLLLALAGTAVNLQPIALCYIGLPIAAGLLLHKGKWWGCLFGIAMGGLMTYNGMNSDATIVFIIGLFLAAYFAAMGLICAASQKK